MSTLLPKHPAGNGLDNVAITQASQARLPQSVWGDQTTDVSHGIDSIINVSQQALSLRPILQLL